MPAIEAPDRAEIMRLLGQGEIRQAMVALRPLVEASDDPEDHLLLGRLAFLTTEYDEATAQLERAYRDFQALGLPRRAAMAASQLGRVHFDGLENQVVGRGWFTRAVGLLEREEPCVERGYLAVGLVGCSVASADELDANARLALDLAHRFGDVALECKALGDWGLALVSKGRIREGMARLDEAFAMIVGGECRDPMVIGQTICCLLSACERCGDVTRAESWLGQIEKNAPRKREGPVGATFAHCWSAFGSVLCQVGRWREAEATLRMGLAGGETAIQQTRLETRAALASLWIRQGRLDEAARLLDGSIDRVEIMAPRARLYLAEGQWDLSAAVARQALRQLTGDQLRAAPLLLIVVEAELGRGSVEAAAQAALLLKQLAEGSEVAAVAAQAALALGRVAASQEDLRSAAQHLQEGIAALSESDFPLLRAALHLELAHVQTAGNPAAAIAEAQVAFAIYQRIGAPEAAKAAGVLNELGVPVQVAPSPPTPLKVLSPREREVLALVAQGMSNPSIAKHLFITAKTAEHHVSSILSKLGLKNRAGAAAFAVSLQISPDERLSAKA
jgi:DNA-binding NarL/FixJ family response regulator